MSKISQVVLQAIFGSVAGAIIWAVLASIIVAFIIYKEGYTRVEIFMSGSLEPEVPIIAGMIFGVINGFLTGLIVGIFEADTVIQSGLAGFIATEIILLLYYVISTLSLIFTAKNLSQALDSIDVSNFIVLSIFLFIPSVLSGIATIKILTLTRSIINFNSQNF